MNSRSRRFPKRNRKDQQMRFMILIKADKKTEAGVMPSEKLLAEMGRFNEELVKAGVMLAGEGLHPSSKAARVKFSGDGRTVIDGPFPVNEVVCGFWLWHVKSKEEAIEWVKRCPNPLDGEAVIEIRETGSRRTILRSVDWAGRRGCPSEACAVQTSVAAVRSRAIHIGRGEAHEGLLSPGVHDEPDRHDVRRAGRAGRRIPVGRPLHGRASEAGVRRDQSELPRAGARGRRFPTDGVLDHPEISRRQDAFAVVSDRAACACAYQRTDGLVQYQLLSRFRVRTRVSAGLSAPPPSDRRAAGGDDRMGEGEVERLAEDLERLPDRLQRPVSAR